jgi:hypothetical protein
MGVKKTIKKKGKTATLVNTAGGTKISVDPSSTDPKKQYTKKYLKKFNSGNGDRKTNTGSKTGGGF